MKNQPVIILKVAPALRSDSTLGRVRLNSESRKSLNLEVGDVVKIIGRRSTAARVFRALPDDEDKAIIRIDQITMKNAGISLGNSIKVCKTEAKFAIKIEITPAIESEKRKTDLDTERSDKFLRKNLLRQIVTNGDIVMIRIPINEIKYVPFQIASTSPRGIVQITEETEIVIKDDFKGD